jgi:hypothetical protein
MATAGAPATGEASAGANAAVPDTGAGSGPAGGPVDAAKLVEDVDHGPTAAVLAELATMGPPTVAVRLGHWAGVITAAAGRPSAGAAYLRAGGADAGGDARAAEAHLRDGLEVAPDHPACLGYLAELTADRGDAPGSLALLRRAGRPLGPEVLGELEPFLVRQVGRNEPCPCGSGRKFKVCCQRHPVPRPLLDRSRWLLVRATRRTARVDALVLQSLRQLFDASGDEFQAMALAADMLLFSNRGLLRYLDSREGLLAEDEMACARSWLGQPLRLLDIGPAGPDGLVEAVDVRTGDRLTIAEPDLPALTGEGEALLARPLPVDGLWLLTSARVRVPRSSRDRALELVEDDLRPFQLLELLVDLQVDAIRR